VGEIIFGETSLKSRRTLFEIPLSVPYCNQKEEFKPYKYFFEKDANFLGPVSNAYQK